MKVVQERLGHKRIEITLGTYAHVLPSSRRMQPPSLRSFSIEERFSISYVEGSMAVATGTGCKVVDMQYKSPRPHQVTIGAAALQSLLLLLLAVGGQYQWPGTIRAIIVIAAVIVIAVKYQSEIGAASKLRVSNIEYILSECVKAVEEHQERVSAGTLRANLMVYRKELRIVASYRMEGAPDKDIAFVKGQGCCGTAYEAQDTIVGDLLSVFHETWEKTRKANDGAVPWGIDREQFQKTTSIKSILSLPLVKPGDKVPRAILNFDDQISIDEARFGDAELIHLIQGYAFHIYCLIGEEGL